MIDPNCPYKDTNISVLMGGMSGEREVSLRSGKKVRESLLSQGYKVISIDAGRDVASRLVEERTEVAYIMLHGRYGEDGTIQGLLEQLGIPYTGSGVLASALAMDKIVSKKIFFLEDIPTPDYVGLSIGINVDEAVDIVTNKLPLPAVIKPVNEGSSLGVIIADNVKALEDGIRKDLEDYRDIIIEPFIEGISVTVGVLGLGKDTRVLPVLELRPKREFYDYEAKYTPGMTEFICPAELEKDVYNITQHYALMAHRSLGCRGFSRVDMQIDRTGKPFVLEVNTIPGMTELSDLPAEAEVEGMSYDELVYEILKSAPVDR
jgi:D-alanine-D-alanine ligase